jgi:exosortase/archaeosortase
MTPAWLISNILWISLFLLLASALSGRNRLASPGWAFFGIYWFTQPAHYIAIEDYFNAALAFFAGIFCFYLAWMILIKGCKSQACTWASYAAAICGII